MNVGLVRYEVSDEFGDVVVELVESVRVENNFTGELFGVILFFPEEDVFSYLLGKRDGLGEVG